MPSIDLATRFKIGMYLLKDKIVTNAFPRSTDIIQVLNDLPTDKGHTCIMVQQYIECYALHTSKTRKNNIFSRKKNLF